MKKRSQLITRICLIAFLGGMIFIPAYGQNDESNGVSVKAWLDDDGFTHVAYTDNNDYNATVRVVVKYSCSGNVSSNQWKGTALAHQTSEEQYLGHCAVTNEDGFIVGGKYDIVSVRIVSVEKIGQ